ncbi:MAG TPA: TIGR02757 family protein [Niabella sp.]|nr:TIGR02757 family protein [Niabella sp.]HQW15846.1 TIGR02757 family protein [Niabella sp.]HQX21058.1 TIGR02757 family protein [Niabella sp.]HQX40879.1 TIGR02757 family protein [Niabella sp.]HRB36887.1 TIGR02757 family protein [Niabella sp.]
MDKKLITLLNEKAVQFEQPGFVPNDPISIPHRFTKKQDIEIAGLFAATLAWGNRKSIVSSCNFLMMLMDNAPFDFIMTFEEEDLIPLVDFVHRTFNATDLFHFLNFLQFHYRYLGEESLETAFSRHLHLGDKNIESALIGFHNGFFDEKYFADYPERTRKHISSPAKKSACKKLNMFLRWMVRDNEKGVDFGLWKSIHPSQLVCPLDIHVSRTARHLGLLHRPQNDWLAATELTENLKMLDPQDPVKYDFALFGMGVEEK